MTPTITAWLTLTLVLGATTSIAIWSRRPTRWRGLSVAAFPVSSLLAAVALSMALSWPVPYWPGVTVPAGRHELLGHKLVEGVGIYVLLDIGPGTPRYYSLEWDTKTAESLQKAAEEGGAEGEHGMHTPAFEFSWDETEPQFWAEPQQALPAKVEPPAPQHFEQDA